MSQAAILCVDDETLVLETLEIEFHKAFNDTYRYEFAESAEEALEIIDELHEEGINILVIVSDWLMPGMKGDELLIQVHDKWPHIVKIMLTGQADQAAIERAQQEGHLLRCLYQPWNSKELVETIKMGLATYS
ncbi:MAG: response regulator [Candidatus Parabeggiatoa sp. nov. 3]|nr:MAG: response regulator [Gammaproteobacteria bacterium]RKZ69445.1 MAG: response regulator [Gammaproteobacteria bacterium]RKZ81654.1 MAG: response regulator [Gammaproteobacteria bacterium]HEW98165.1 response regulator [Beggiatoa sp.]